MLVILTVATLGFLLFFVTLCSTQSNQKGVDIQKTNLLELSKIHGEYAYGSKENGFIVDNLGQKNNIGIFEPVVVAMEFEADIDILDGDSAVGLMFGVENIYASDNKWSAVHIQPSRDNTVRVFCEENYWQDDGLESGNLQTSKDFLNETVHIKITINDNKLLKVFVDDMTKVLYTKFLVNYYGGHVGIMTHTTKAKFSNIQLIGTKFPSINSLEIEGIEFEEKFSTDTYNYTAFVDNNTSSIHVKATSESGNYFIDGKKYNNGEISKIISLNVGVNKISVGTNQGDNILYPIEISVVRAYDDENAYQETYRPQFHYSQKQFWCNDPNGLIYNAYTKEYHMFYQYNPSAMHLDGQSHWGHAISKDLMHWTELPVAMYPDDIGIIASGSCVIDRNNTSGLFDDSIPKESRMVAIYTYYERGSNSWIGGEQRQAIAYSKDNGYTWIKYENNPVIANTNNEYGKDFRDPKVIWMEESNEWLMITAGGRAKIFTSKDLIKWELNSSLSTSSGQEIHSECPDLFPLAVDGNQNNIKWVFSGGGVFYVIGNLIRENGKYVFKAETEKIVMFEDAGFGRSMYATQSFANVGNNIIFISWMPQSDANQLGEEGKIWNGNQSIPMQAQLVTTGYGVSLTVMPISKMETLRSKTLFTANNIAVNEGDTNILTNVNGKIFDVDAEITFLDATEFGFKLRLNDGDFVKASISKTDKKLMVDKSNSSVLNTGVIQTDVDIIGDKVQLRILVDSSIIDVFANNGISRINTVYYTKENAESMEFYTINGGVVINSMKIYEMKSTWIKENMEDISPILADIGIIDNDFDFDPFVKEYSLEINDKNKIEIKPTFYWSSTIMVKINEEQIQLGQSKKIALVNGSNKVYVTISDKVGKSVYIINIDHQNVDSNVANTRVVLGIIITATIVLVTGSVIVIIKTRTKKR